MLTRRNFAGVLAGTVGGGALVAASAAGTATAAEQSTSTWDRIMSTKKLRLPAIAANQPHMWKDVDGKWVGWLAELGTVLAADLGCEVVYSEATWATAILDLQADKVDLMFGAAPTPQRLMALDCSEPMYKTRLAATVRPGLDVKTWSDLDKPEIKLAVDIGTAHDHMASRLCPNAEILRFKSVEEAALAVRSRRADAHVIYWTSSKRSVITDPQIGSTVVPKPIFFSSSTIAVRRDVDKTWRDFINGWIGYARGAGIIQTAYLGNLAKIGIDPKEALEGIEF